MSTGIFLRVKSGQRVSLTTSPRAYCLEKMCEPRRLITLWAFTVCYRDSFYAYAYAYVHQLNLVTKRACCTVKSLNRFSLSLSLSLFFCFDTSGIRAGRLGFQSRQRQIFSFLHNVQTGSGAHPASYAIGTIGFFPGNNAAGASR
jgi:hypothetical protein